MQFDYQRAVQEALTEPGRVPPNVEDITGRKFGRLTAIGFSHIGPRPGYARMWWFQCECGVHVIRNVRHTPASCGCLRREVSVERAAAKATHGMSQSRLYRTWINLNDRCYNPKNASYKSYGSRGIAVCEEWRENFEPFCDWALANGYQDNLQIDRGKNHLGYSPTNCRWVTCRVNQNNRRSNKTFPFQGKTRTVSEIARLIGVPPFLVASRLRKGYSIEEAAVPFRYATNGKPLTEAA